MPISICLLGLPIYLIIAHTSAQTAKNEHYVRISIAYFCHLVSNDNVITVGNAPDFLLSPALCYLLNSIKFMLAD